MFRLIILSSRFKKNEYYENNKHVLILIKLYTWSNLLSTEGQSTLGRTMVTCFAVQNPTDAPLDNPVTKLGQKLL